MRARAADFYAELERRRTVREFARDPVTLDIVETCVATASTAPSGAHQQPWTFVIVSDPATKAAMREAAEAEERRNYAERMSAEWRSALEPLGTDAVKTHITDAPHVIVVFAQSYGLEPDASEPSGKRRRKHYYVDESVGIAVGFLLAALHHAGLATLTHTPSPMGFLRDLLGRPENERAWVLIPVGYPAPDAQVPDIHRKPLDAVCVRR
jgi:nitroreductase